MPPSLANAQTDRDTAVVHPIPHSKASTASGIRSMNEPAEFPTADLMMLGTGWPDCSAMRAVVSGSTKTNGIRNRRPAIVLMMIVPTMAFGTCRDGSCTSSHILRKVSMSYEASRK